MATARSAPGRRNIFAATGAGLGLLLAFLVAGLVWADPAPATPTPVTSPSSPSVSASGLVVSANPTAGAGTASTVSISVSDGVSDAKPGSQHTYQVLVTNGSDADRQLLLEITPPAGATVDDAGGGTMNAALIEYGVTIRADSQVSERFQVTLGPARAGQTRADTLASAFLLGGASSGGSAPAARATDSDAIIGAGPAATASTAAASNGAGKSSHHTGLWIGALALGALLIVVGVAVIFWPASPPGRRRAATGRPGRLAEARELADRPGSSGLGARGLDRSHPSRTARRAAQAATEAGIHSGAHQADRAHRTRSTQRSPL